MSQPNADIAALIAAEGARPMEIGSLASLREKVAEARDLEMERVDLQVRTEEVSRRLNILYSKELPELLDMAQVPKIVIEAEGNMPRVEVKVVPFYAANIAVAWDEEKRRAAFEYLQEEGFGDLIKTEVNLAFNREDRAKALAVKEALERKGLEPVVRESVHSSTLTAWLKEQVEKKHRIPDIEKIGGTISRIAKLKGIK